MRKQILILGLLITIGLQQSYGQEKISITTENKGSVNYYKINEFYFVHQLFADAFFMTNLYKQLSYDEMTDILKAVLYKIDNNNKVTLRIIQEKGPEAKIVFFIKEGTKDGTLLAMMTNFNKETRKFTKTLDEQNSLVRWYFIKDDKLVYRNDLYSENLENEKKKGMAFELIDFYLFDSNKENDTKVKGLIDAILNDSNSNLENIFYAKLYLGEYYLLNDDISSAEKAVVELNDFYKKYKDNGIPAQHILMTNMAQTELEIMKRIKK